MPRDGSGQYTLPAEANVTGGVTVLTETLWEAVFDDIETALGTITTFGFSILDDADAGTARTTLGLGTIATQDSDSVTITGGSITGITDLAVADGGTGASTAAGARTNLGAANIAGDTFTGNVTVTSTDAGASVAPIVDLYRNSASPAALDSLGEYRFSAENSGGSQVTVGRVQVLWDDPTASSEDSTMLLSTVRGGTLGSRVRIEDGLSMVGATGGDQGAGTVNASAVYVDGVAVKTDYGVGDGQTWQDVSGSRAEDTSYQNTTGKPIQLAIRSAGGDLEVSSNGSTWLNLGTLANGFPVIPDDYYYRFTATFSHWAELR